MRPPASTAAHVPSFEHDQPVDIATDAWDSPEHEVLALGGAPSPALGILANASSANLLERTSTAITCARNSYMSVR